MNKLGMAHCIIAIPEWKLSDKANQICPYEKWIKKKDI